MLIYNLLTSCLSTFNKIYMRPEILDDLTNEKILGEFNKLSNFELQTNAILCRDYLTENVCA